MANVGSIACPGSAFDQVKGKVGEGDGSVRDSELAGVAFER
jgi:hypothetical protein